EWARLPSSADRLESWNEIAAYLKRGVRTVRRWEREEGLPVHRHQHRVLGSVYAFTSEIDRWRATSRQSPRDRVARIVMDALELRLTPEERDRLAGRPRHSVAAHECA